MARRAIIFATWISTGLLVSTLVLAISSIWLDPWNHRWSLGPDFHLGVWGHGCDIRLVFFNDAEHGPYRGSVILPDPGLQRELRIGPVAGVYYRYFRWTNATLWTLMVLIWYPAALFAVLPAWRLIRRIRGPVQSSPAPNPSGSR